MWLCGMNLFCVWGLTFNRMCGWETHLAVVSHAFLCLHVFSGKDDVWLHSPKFPTGTWFQSPENDLQILCTAAIQILFHSYKQTHQLSLYILSRAVIPSAPCLAPWPWITAPALGLVFISSAGGAERSSANSLWGACWCLSLPEAH